ncbi:muramoyltetrapeptide carboxypeptidase LdcA involved in peptidoglycan recycling [Thermosporothrix hazakensis]|jgi:muramoyltetrapeptide carboxypeptidase LdcA involved in peptidoglycan recycling|uniref:Muramoyltetrapeptide carboxypeptidase LdcA involved in peptidoglycan recycling n=2 Tax=Thermosporothrix TaxID=768650 RepID=A0A326UKK5_THEHA|nr:S66 peptidase family protein [Thermosporothrix hazakensis]PZW29477.1 muramoyltetrapeptide carboxypeptidase LdcA involved in peptidoglycan recycling [Thermosporothrix hazakensis]BBH85762.1 LD-carboxypeptidase [Thermosporothrix sp. COM3]GCE45808.1 LD-carboxypeptidase [Thermosporothrix hazakensis]
MFTRNFQYPAPVQAGDKVAILSPSSGLPEIFPDVYELGLQRLRDLFGLQPVEYPTTRKMHSRPEDRARDIHAAFRDPEIKALIASIGGDDQLKVLKYLDPELIRANPKPFFGYSDNTNLHNYLWNLGIVSYHGGSILVHFGRGGSMHPDTVTSLKQALFTRGEYELKPALHWTDEPGDWRDPEFVRKEPHMFPGEGWTWHNAGEVIEGTTWGGNLEILDWNMRANRYIQPVESYAGSIFYIETSEEMPSALEVYRILMCMGERGLLKQFPAVIVGRPKAWDHNQPFTAEQKARYYQEQRDAILQAFHEYNPAATIVFNVDFGHTDPQLILPNGGKARIDGVQKRIFVTY